MVVLLLIWGFAPVMTTCVCCTVWRLLLSTKRLSYRWIQFSVSNNTTISMPRALLNTSSPHTRETEVSSLHWVVMGTLSRVLCHLESFWLLTVPLTIRVLVTRSDTYWFLVLGRGGGRNFQIWPAFQIWHLLSIFLVWSRFKAFKSGESRGRRFESWVAFALMILCSFHFCRTIWTPKRKQWKKVNNEEDCSEVTN